MNLAHPKILARADLPGRLPALRAGKRLVFTNGCFDILHPGHCDLLARCRALGDLLLVAVNSDASVTG
jgi:bifunctional ADP-heptose synthase (sugar kinase/adenylyltransferase)